MSEHLEKTLFYTVLPTPKNAAWNGVNLLKSEES